MHSSVGPPAIIVTLCGSAPPGEGRGASPERPACGDAIRDPESEAGHEPEDWGRGRGFLTHGEPYRPRDGPFAEGEWPPRLPSRVLCLSVADAPCQMLCAGDLHLGRHPSGVWSRDRAWAVDHV